MPRPANDYNPVPTVESEGGGGSSLSARATPEAFGAGVGQAIEKLGATGEQVGGEEASIQTQFARMATEAKVNDDYANSYAPAAAQLRAQYDSLRGQDKIHGYQDYVDGLKTLNQSYAANAKSPLEQHLISGLIDRHVAGEIDGAKRELVSSQKEFSDRATTDAIIADSGYAANNYNNPAIVKQVEETNNNRILMQHIDAGHDPNSSEGRLAISEAQRTATGQMATGMINQAIKTGDVATANKIRADYSTTLPGYQQLSIDNTLHTENMRQTGVNAVNAIKSGQPIPHSVGAPPVVVQATVADAAQQAGVDPNHALTIARIESSNGQNVGARGDIGQTGKGGNLQEQAQNLVLEAKKSETVADNALGRKSEPWEQYTCYQQGAGGGAALLKADPNEKAVDVLAPLYKNSKDALTAVTHNGGNSTMSVGDFLDFIKQKYQDNAARAMCEIPSAQTSTVPGEQAGQTAIAEKVTPLSEAIMAPHQETGQTVQPAATPMGALRNWNEKTPAMLERINSIPNIEVRQGVMKQWEESDRVIRRESSAYISNLANQSYAMTADPHFTSISQMPAEMQSALMSENPKAYDAALTRADYNLKNLGHAVSADKSQMGSGVYDVFSKVVAPANDPKGINDLNGLMAHAGKDGDITPAGFDMIKPFLDKKNSPDGQAELGMLRDYLAKGRSQITGSNAATGYKDSKGDKLFDQFMALTLSDYQRERGAGTTPAQLLTPGGNKYLGDSITGFKRTLNQQVEDMMKDSQEGGLGQSGARTLANIVAEAQATKDPAKQAALKEEAIKLGFVRAEEAKPQVPIAH